MHDTCTDGCCTDGCCSNKDAGMTIGKYEMVVLGELLKYSYLPISRFVMCSSKTDDISFTALGPVYIDEKNDTMETVKSMANLLKSMEESNLISLDYDKKLQGYDYDTHMTSDVFCYFEETVREGHQNAGFVCDIAAIECGSAALTDFGLIAAQNFFRSETIMDPNVINPNDG